jgi:23S rRNA (adenine2030-N6)-methyltransferase
MNYRHAFHAGNFADCFKHALLVALLDSLSRKPAPYFVLDTHAGAGHYDLGSSDARRTAEADAGIQRLLTNPDPALQRYLGTVEALGLYPGSPAIIRSLLRDNDRLACCELHPEEADKLRAYFPRDSRIEVHRRSAWEALTGLLPPKEKRGLVFIDPPFEARDEFLTLADGLKRGHARFGHGIFAAWYPVKQMAAVRGFHADMKASGIRDIVAIELRLREPTDPDRLNGCGLLTINPPFQFETAGAAIAASVLAGLGASEAGAGVEIVRLADE